VLRVNMTSWIRQSFDNPPGPIIAVKLYFSISGALKEGGVL